MRSNYNKLGDYISPVDLRNRKLEISNLIGLSIQKKFIPSISNIIGTDMSTYRIINQNQFAYCPVTSRNGEKITIALYQEPDTAIISQAYEIFEITRSDELIPEYLMMWFRRPEFDRYARFVSHGSVREMFGWEEMCNVMMPIPHPDKQKEIVNEYNTIVNRINLNNQLIQKLEETAQTIYKQWFVEFEFPDENGKPYKSSGGAMEFNEELEKEIPKEWRNGFLNEMVNIIDGDRGTNYPSNDEMTNSGFCLFLNAGNASKTGFVFKENTFISQEKDKLLRKGKVIRNDLVLTTRGTVGNVGYYSDAITFNDIRINSGMVILRGKEFIEATIFVYSLLRNSEIKIAIDNFLSGSAQPQLPIKDLIKIPVLVPKTDLFFAFSNIALKIQLNIDLLKIQNLKLDELNNLNLSKLATMGS